MVEKYDKRHYSSMQWYSKTGIDYNESYLKSVSETDEYNNYLIYDEQNVRIYKIR
jgi:hypothetical protein